MAIEQRQLRTLIITLFHSYGNYFYVNTLTGINGDYIDAKASQAVDFHISNTAMITTTNTNRYNSTLTCNW
jgi:hypothetical protein